MACTETTCTGGLKCCTSINDNQDYYCKPESQCI